MVNNETSNSHAFNFVQYSKSIRKSTHQEADKMGPPMNGATIPNWLAKSPSYKMMVLANQSILSITHENEII